MVRRHNHLKFGYYHQHLHELLEMDLSPLDYMLKKFPEFKDRDAMRKVIGRYGITGKAQTAPIKQLSDGQRYVGLLNPGLIIRTKSMICLKVKSIAFNGG